MHFLFSRVSHHFFPMAMICDWKWNRFFFYSRDPSFMSLIDSPLFVKFSKKSNFNFRESWFGFFLFSEIRDQNPHFLFFSIRLWKRCSKYMDFVLQTGCLSHITIILYSCAVCNLHLLHTNRYFICSQNHVIQTIPLCIVTVLQF
jgi:hypothetical protein